MGYCLFASMDVNGLHFYCAENQGKEIVQVQQKRKCEADYVCTTEQKVKHRIFSLIIEVCYESILLTKNTYFC